MSTAAQAKTSVVTRACRDAMPVALAYAPFGLALGATLAASRIPRLIAWSSSPLLFSGAAQLLAVQLLDAGASRPAYAAAAAGGLVAVVASGLPLGLGLLAGGPGSRADPGRVRAGRAGRVHHFVYDVITDGVPVAIEVDIPLRSIMWGFDSVLAS